MRGAGAPRGMGGRRRTALLDEDDVRQSDPRHAGLHHRVEAPVRAAVGEDDEGGGDVGQLRDEHLQSVEQRPSEVGTVLGGVPQGRGRWPKGAVAQS